MQKIKNFISKLLQLIFQRVSDLKDITKARRNIYHLVWDGLRYEWYVFESTDITRQRMFKNKIKAYCLSTTREFCNAQKSLGIESTIVVHRRDGTIQDNIIYNLLK